MPSEPALAAARAGQEIDAVLACTRKERLVARSGSPYLALELRDSTAALPARVPRRRRPRRPLRARRPRPRPRPGRAVSRGPDARRARHRPRPARHRPGRVPARRLPRPRRAGRLLRAPRARGARRRPARAAARSSWRTQSSRPRFAAPPVNFQCSIFGGGPDTPSQRGSYEETTGPNFSFLGPELAARAGRFVVLAEPADVSLECRAQTPEQGITWGSQASQVVARPIGSVSSEQVNLP